MSSHVDIALVNLPHRTLGTYPVGEHLGLCYLASCLRQAGYRTEIVDGCIHRMSLSGVVREVQRMRPRVTGLSVSEPCLPQAIVLTRHLRRAIPDLHITAGGFLPTLAGEGVFRLIPGLNSVITGEGELAILDLMRRLGSSSLGEGIVLHGEKPALDELPPPARDTLPLHVKMGFPASLSTSRGCIGTCTYCSAGSYARASGGAPWRARSIESVVAELESLVKEYGVRIVKIVDDNFLGPQNGAAARVREFVNQLKALRLKARFSLSARVDTITYDMLEELKSVGLSFLSVGIESCVQRELDEWDKNSTIAQIRAGLRALDKSRIPYNAGFIMFGPNTTLEELRIKVEFMMGFAPSTPAAALNVMRPFCGTPLAFQLQDAGRLRGKPGFLSFSFSDPRVAAIHQNLKTRLLRCFRSAVITEADRYRGSAVSRAAQRGLAELSELVLRAGGQ